MKKILVIEDNAEVNENLCEILELSGYEAFSALDGKLGVEAANTRLPDLILCDVMMPHLDGYGVLRILSQNERTAHIPLIFLTAKSEMKDLRKGMNLGAADYILKPFDDVDLLQSIAVRLAQQDKPPSNSDINHNSLHGLNVSPNISELKKEWSNKYETRIYKAKSQIYTEGAHPRFVYFIIKGVVRIHKMSDIGKTITLDLRSTYKLIGEGSILNNTPYNEDASALTDCEIINIPAPDFLDLLQQNSPFALYCFRNTLSQLDDQHTAYLDMAYSSVRRKVAVSLIKFAKAIYNDSIVNGLSIYAPREELAELVGSAKETIIRTLSDFKSEGLIEVDNHKIVLIDLEGLIYMSN